MSATAKICGITTIEIVDAAVAGGASHVGFVFFPPSPRHLALDQAAALAARVPDYTARVGVFVDPDDMNVVSGSRKYSSVVGYSSSKLAQVSIQ